MMMKATLLFSLIVSAAGFSSSYLSQLSAPQTSSPRVNGDSFSRNPPNSGGYDSYMPQTTSAPPSANTAGAYDNHAPPYMPQPTQTPAPREARSGGPSQELLDLISKQVSVELAASQTYLAASIWVCTIVKPSTAVIVALKRCSRNSLR